MELINKITQALPWNVLIGSSLRLLLILVVGWGMLKLASFGLNRMEQRLIAQSRVTGEPPDEAAKRVETLIKLVRQAVRVVLLLTILMVLLREIGVDVGPILASAGVVGLAIGFGAQNLVRDLIAGFFIIMENQARVGDVIIVNGTGGLVERMNMRTIVLRDLGGVVHVFPNGSITTLANMTRDWSAYLMDIGVAYKEDPDHVIEVMKRVADEVQADEILGPHMLGPIEVFGVDKLGDSAVVIKARLRTKPIRQWDVGRNYLKRLKLAFDAEGIEIPFPHRTLYFGEVSKPFAVKLAEQAQLRGQSADGADDVALDARTSNVSTD